MGPIPEGMSLDHLCDTPRCINPEHLKPVSIRDNVLRSEITRAGINLRRTECINGHQFTVENTYVRPYGGRTCRECHKLNERRRRGFRENNQRVI